MNPCAIQFKKISAKQFAKAHFRTPPIKIKSYITIKFDSTQLLTAAYQSLPTKLPAGRHRCSALRGKRHKKRLCVATAKSTGDRNLRFTNRPGQPCGNPGRRWQGTDVTQQLLLRHPAGRSHRPSGGRQLESRPYRRCGKHKSCGPAGSFAGWPPPRWRASRQSAFHG